MITIRAAMIAGACVGMASVAGPPPSGYAIDLAPSADRIRAALERGQEAATQRIPPDRLYAWFGSTEEFAPRGFVMTKLVGIQVMATHFALRGEHPADEDVQRIIAEPSLLISVTWFGDRPTFAADSYMVLTQGNRIIKPVKVRSDGRAPRSPAWPRSPAFQAKIVASFPYDQIDPTALTRISVYPASGGELAFDLNFATID